MALCTPLPNVVLQPIFHSACINRSPRGVLSHTRYKKPDIIIIINEYPEAGLAAPIFVQHIYSRHKLQQELY